MCSLYIYEDVFSQENVLLKSLNLSMNGLSTPGSLFLGETLKKNEALTYLDISFNRIYDEGAAHLAKGLEKNERLHNLIVSTLKLVMMVKRCFYFLLLS